jgi:hypothetical protein
VPALLAEVAEMRSALDRPAARRLSGQAASRRCASTKLQHFWLPVNSSSTRVVAVCGTGAAWRPLARRPVLFALVRALAEAWPNDVDRETLIARAFNTRRPNETHRARLRVEIGRLRALVAEMARIEATSRGFVLKPRRAKDVCRCSHRLSTAIRRHWLRCSPMARPGRRRP